MNMGFFEIVNSIERELGSVYLGGAIKWIDEHKDNAWSKEVDLFDRALAGALERQDYFSAKMAGEHYKLRITEFIQVYKKENGSGEQDSFLGMLKELGSIGNIKPREIE